MISSRQDLLHWLYCSSTTALQDLFDKAYKVRIDNVGSTVFLRGIIEFSNICSKNCFYCGIRRGNSHIERFSMSAQEITETAEWVLEAGYGSIVLQSGERNDEAYIDFVESVLIGIRDATGGKLGITLSLGEQSADTLKRWMDAGSHRYLLRIETSNRNLYSRLHPEDHSWDIRLRCLDILRDQGWQVGTGVMIGLPGQTMEDLADDIIFFADRDIDMIGMGPFIPHKDTRYGCMTDGFDGACALTLALKVISLTRLFLADVNIAATTALQALDPLGREKGLLAGANIIMPNVTHTKYRHLYHLYEDKPCLDENDELFRDGLEARIALTGERIGYNRFGDSPHFFRRLGIEPSGR